MAPFLGFHEFASVAHRLECQCIIKGYNLGTAGWKPCIGQGTWEGARSFQARFRAPVSPNRQVFTQTVLSAAVFWGGFIT